MEELREIAEAHYETGSPEVQKLARDFFDALDTNRDKKVNRQEFLAFMGQEGLGQMQNRKFFRKLDVDGNKTLDFYEVMTLYYIIKSGRPFCECCGKFIPGIYFSCVECFKSFESSYNLCFGCYKSKKYEHDHNGNALFLDNFRLLEAQRNAATGVNKNEPEAPGSSSSKSPNTIVPAPKAKKWSVALKTLEAAIVIGNISGILCTIL